MPEPSMPSSLKRRPAVSMILCLVACLCSLLYRTAHSSTCRVGHSPVGAVCAKWLNDTARPAAPDRRVRTGLRRSAGPYPPVGGGEPEDCRMVRPRRPTRGSPYDTDTAAAGDVRSAGELASAAPDLTRVPGPARSLDGTPRRGGPGPRAGGVRHVRRAHRPPAVRHDRRRQLDPVHVGRPLVGPVRHPRRVLPDAARLPPRAQDRPGGPARRGPVSRSAP